MDFVLLSTTDIIPDIVEKINNAKSEIVMISMVISDGRATEDLMKAIDNAAKRGVKVKMAADYFTFISLGGFLVFNHFRNKDLKRNSKTLKKLRENGVKFTWLGSTNWSIMNGRTHCKWITIDDFVYSFGGINFYQEGLENCDYMFRVRSEEISKELNRKFDEILDSDKRKFSPKNENIKIDDKSQILFDGGFVGKSIIYTKVYELAKNAKKITLVSQYPPTGKLARLLKKRATDVFDIKLYFNTVKTARSSNKIIIKLGEISGLKNEYKKQQYLHAKFIIFEDENGQKTAVSGSHNFTAAGGLFGTRELALLTTDEKIILQLENFLKNEVCTDL